MNNKTLISSKEFSNQDLLKFNVYMEMNSNIYKDVVFFELYKKYKTKYSMELNINKLRVLKNSCKVLLKYGECKTKIYTSSSKSFNSNNENINSISFNRVQNKNVDENSIYYINYSNGINSYSFKQNKIEFISFVESLNVLCDFSEEQYFRLISSIRNSSN